MDSALIDFLGLLVRWLHVIAGIAWIGSSFYFIWLDNSLDAPAPGSDTAKKGVGGELWAVHGGGFYNPQKYLVAPAAHAQAVERAELIDDPADVELLVEHGDHEGDRRLMHVGGGRRQLYQCVSTCSNCTARMR